MKLKWDSNDFECWCCSVHLWSCHRRALEAPGTSWFSYTQTQLTWFSSQIHNILTFSLVVHISKPSRQLNDAFKTLLLIGKFHFGSYLSRVFISFELTANLVNFMSLIFSEWEIDQSCWLYWMHDQWGELNKSLLTEEWELLIDPLKAHMRFLVKLKHIFSRNQECWRF